MAGARIMTAEQARGLFDSVAADALRTEAQRWYDFLQQRLEEVGRQPKYHRMLGEMYGQLTAYLDHGDVEAVVEGLDWMRAEAQFFANHPDFPAEPVDA